MTWHLLIDYDRAQDVPGHQPLRTVAHVRPQPDSARAHEVICKRLARAGYKVLAWSFERSTNGWHAKVSLSPAPASPMETVALQAICGSDPSRESCNVQRARGLEDMDARHHALRLRHVLTNRHWEPADELRAAVYAGVMDALVEGFPTRDGTVEFYRTRWNTLYAPNPKRRKDGKGK